MIQIDDGFLWILFLPLLAALLAFVMYLFGRIVVRAIRG
jgi:hypothetical protein